jgi:hypothetical protein
MVARILSFIILTQDGVTVFWILPNQLRQPILGSRNLAKRGFGISKWGVALLANPYDPPPIGNNRPDTIAL